MTVNSENQNVNQETAALSDKELNFRKQEAMYQRMLEEKEREKQEAIRQAQELAAKYTSKQQDDDDDDEPYVDIKKLKKTLQDVIPRIKEEAKTELRQEMYKTLEEDKKNNWLKSNPDFYDVMQHAQRFAEKDPELAETILNMPDTFERQKLVYKNIKALGLHKKEEEKPSIQDTIDRNKRSPYYQPSGVGSPPYASVGDYSPSGQKSAYDKMQELKNRLRI